MRILTIALLFIARAALADCTTADAIGQLRPGAIWTLRGDTYDGLQWQDTSQTKPTRTQVENMLATCTVASLNREAAKRAARFNVKLSTATQAQKISALILLLDLDR
jgi:hypothetical protein